MPPPNDADRVLAAKKALRPYLTFPAWAAMGLVLVLAIALPAQIMTKIAPYPFLFSLIFLGLPHGAWDHLVVSAARQTRLGAGHLAAVCVSYSLLVASFGVLWFAAPSAAFAAFILLSWLHWGQGDAAYLRLWRPERVGPPAWLTWLVRGGAPILLPILRFPDAFARIAAGVVGLFTPHHVQWQIPWGGRVAGFVLLAALVLAYLFLLFRAVARDREPGFRAAREDAAEVFLLYLVFAVADPLFAVGIYFCFWHGLRHIGRLLLIDNTNRALCAQGRVLSAAARFGAQCFPILAVSLGLLGAAYQAAHVGNSGSAPNAALFVYLALIACLTFPHFLLVCWMDGGAN